MPSKPAGKKPRWSGSKKAAARRNQNSGGSPGRTRADRGPDGKRGARPAGASSRERRDDRGSDAGRSGNDRFAPRSDRGYGTRSDRGQEGRYSGRFDRSQEGRSQEGRYAGRSERDQERRYSERPDRSQEGRYAGRSERDQERRYSERPDRGRERDRGYAPRTDRDQRNGQSPERGGGGGGYKKRDQGGYPGRGYSSRPDRDRRRGDGPDGDRRRSDDRQSPARRDDRPARQERKPARDYDSRQDYKPARDYGSRQDYRSRDDRPPRRDHKHHSRDGAPPIRDSHAARSSHEPPVQVVTVDADNGFAALGVPTEIVHELARESITAPFPIQQATIPDALAGRDVLGRGRTGSGKTLAFGIPMVTRLAGGHRRPKQPRAVVMVPTRELAMQVSDALEPLTRAMRLRQKVIAGGLAYEPQISAIARGVDILVATPGRMKDLMERGAMDLGAVEIVVLDEADHMAEMGFIEDVTTLLEAMPSDGQRLLFSATLDRGIDKVVERFLTDPTEHATDTASASVTTMAHHVFLVSPHKKKQLTAELANRSGRTVIFVRTKLGADRVARELRESGVFAAALHGGLTQAARNRVLEGFRNGDLPVLVATDVAARGIHVDDVSVVLQADPPADHKDYLHRAGRTARAGESGAVVTLALPHQRKTMEKMLSAAGVDIAPATVNPGDPVVASVGGRPATGVPIDAATYRRVVEPPRRGRRPSSRFPQSSRKNFRHTRSRG